MSLASLLTGLSLLISPASQTYHFTPLGEATPRHIGNVNSWTYHPQFSLLASTYRMQYAAFFLSDTFANPAGGAGLGPKWNLYKDYINVGLLGGVYVREKTSANKFPIALNIGVVQLVPLPLATIGITIPITKKMGLGIETELAPNLIHQDVGIRVKF